MLMVPLLAISGMAVDLGGWYAQGARMQKAADAAALAAVVWLPDLAKATAVAKDTTKRNGWDDAASDIVVTVAQTSTTELKVTILDTTVPLGMAKLFLSDMRITREASAEYVLAVPMGSPRNYFGTGNLAPTPEGFWAAINGWCAPKEQGDPLAPGFMGNWPGGGIQCPGGTANPDYVPDPDYPYEYIVDLPTNRTQPVVIHLYHPEFTGTAPDGCCGTMTTMFRLRSPDNTPLNDTDNPISSCTGTGESNPRSYVTNGTDNDATIFGVSGWSKYCTIGTSAPAGRYLFSVRSQENQASSWVSNSYSVMASYNGTGATCDARTDATCPKVYGKEWISIFAQSTSPNADFFLSEIGPEHAGKQMQVTLFDPGEGGNTIQILDPAGSVVNFSYVTRDGLYSGGPLSQLDVSGCTGQPQIGTGRAGSCKFNERYVVLLINIPSNYATLFPGQKWWKIKYNFNANVQDRSSWSVQVLGDPVHLSG